MNTLPGDKMLNSLLESQSNHDRSLSGAVASVAAHTALIGLAIYATAQARIAVAPQTQVVHIGPFRVAPSRSPASAVRTRAVRSNPGTHRLVFVNPDVRITLPSIDIPLTTLGPGDFRRDPADGGPALDVGSSGTEGGYATFRADQVERQVSLISGSASARYPESLRVAGVEGQALAQFVVDAAGRVEEETVRFVRSDNSFFEASVRAALSRMRFTPAEIGGKKVRQLVEMPFVFALSR